MGNINLGRKEQALLTLCVPGRVRGPLPLRHPPVRPAQRTGAPHLQQVQPLLQTGRTVRPGAGNNSAFGKTFLLSFLADS